MTKQHEYQYIVLTSVENILVLHGTTGQIVVTRTSPFNFKQFDCIADLSFEDIGGCKIIKKMIPAINSKANYQRKDKSGRSIEQILYDQMTLELDKLHQCLLKNNKIPELLPALLPLNIVLNISKLQSIFELQNIDIFLIAEQSCKACSYHIGKYGIDTNFTLDQCDTRNYVESAKLSIEYYNNAMKQFNSNIVEELLNSVKQLVT
jgi:hypothetical protein